MATHKVSWSQIARWLAATLEGDAHMLEHPARLTPKTRRELEREVRELWATWQRVRSDVDARTMLKELIDHMAREPHRDPTFLPDQAVEGVIHIWAQRAPHLSSLEPHWKLVAAAIEAAARRTGRGQHVARDKTKEATLAALCRAIHLPVVTGASARRSANRRRKRV